MDAVMASSVYSSAANYCSMQLMLCAGDIGNYYYGQGHPMKPQRIRMCHNLLLNYGLYRKMEIYVSMRCTHLSKIVCYVAVCMIMCV